MLKKFLKWFIAVLSKWVYEPVTLDKLNKKVIEPVPGLLVLGKQAYRFANQADMPQARFAHFLTFHNELRMGITTDLLNEYIDKVVEANDKGQRSEIGQLMFMLKDTANNCTPIESLYNVAALMFFNRDEDLGCYDFDYNERKIAAFKSNNDQSFFLRTALKYSTAPGESLPDNIEDSLALSQEKLHLYRRMLSESFA